MRHLPSFCVAVTMLVTQANAQQTVSVMERNSQQFLSCSDLAEFLDMKFEVVQEGSLVTFCSKGVDALCIPVQLSDSNHQTNDGEVFLLVSAAKSSLPIDVSIKSGKATVRQTSSPSEGQTPALDGYNSPWPNGRGFGLGQTVPDIPLVDMDGGEVRFSNYLGKRYILYCWASW